MNFIYKKILFLYLFILYYNISNYGRSNNLLYLNNNSYIYVDSKAYLHCDSNIIFQDNAKIYNYGNINILGNVYKKIISSNKNLDYSLNNFIIKYKSFNNYGQIIFKDHSYIDVNLSLEYPFPQSDSNKYILTSLPFNKQYQPRSSLGWALGNREYDYFYYHPSKTLQALENSTLLEFNINSKTAQWDPVDNILLNDYFDNTKPYVFKFIDISNNIFITGIPDSGPYKILNKGLKQLYPLQKKYTDYYNVKNHTYQPLIKILGGDYFTLYDSKNFGRNFFPFANPTYSNIDLLMIPGFIDNVLGVSVVNHNDVMYKYEKYIIRFDSYLMTGFFNGIPTGDIDALNLKLRHVMYLKFRPDLLKNDFHLVIDNLSKTFSFNSSYKKKERYDKLCLEFKDIRNIVDRAYVFAIRNGVDEVFLEGSEVRQPYHDKLKGPILYTLQNKNSLDDEDFSLPLHTNIISYKWVNKPIRLMINNVSKFRNAKVKILNQAGCDCHPFTIVRKGMSDKIENNLIVDGKFFKVDYYGWNKFDIYYHPTRVYDFF
jgi:hypothetical protein